MTENSESIGRDEAFLTELHKHWFGEQDTKIGRPRVLTSPLVSGSAVVDSSVTWETIVANDDTIIALEMEAYGVIYATAMFAGPYKPECLIAKSVCDFGKFKTKEFQKYASYTSVMFVQRFLSKYSLGADSTSHPNRQNVYAD